MAGALPPADPPHAWVVEYRPLDRCFPPACKIGSRAVHGYATAVMEDGAPGAYVAQGPSIEHEQFFERGVLLRPGESFDFDLPEGAHASELDVILASSQGETEYDAEIAIRGVPSVGPPLPIAESHHRGRTAAFTKPSTATVGQFDKYGTHVRLALPEHTHRGLSVSIVNRGRAKLAVGSPLVMRRVDGRGPRQGFVVVHDAVAFHEAEAFLWGGMHDPRADWVSKAVANRGVYFPAGQSPGQSTLNFVLRFATGGYFRGFGWPGMFGQGLDETPLPVLPGPIARAAEQGFVTAFFGNNWMILPSFASVGWDVGLNSELHDSPLAIMRAVEQWALERPHDDALILWWNSETHPMYGPGRTGSPAPAPKLLPKEWVPMRVDGTWRNLLYGADRLEVAYNALRKASPHASRVMWLDADHSSGITTKMMARSFRSTRGIATGLAHGAGATSEEANTPFALVFDDPEHRRPPSSQHVVAERTSALIGWRAFESFLGLTFDLPRTSTFESPLFPDPLGQPVWNDRILVSVGVAMALRGSLGDTSYALFVPKLTEAPAWKLSTAQQLLLTGGPSRSQGVADEELFDDRDDPYELKNLAGPHLEDTIRMRSEMSDWLAAHWEDHKRRRHRYQLVFSEAVDLDLFAPHPFTALVGETPVPSADGRLAHVHGKEIAILEVTDPVNVIEVRGARSALVLKCSANGLPLDVLTPDRTRFNLEIARTNCPLPAGPHDVAGPGEVLFSFEPAPAHPLAPQGGVPSLGNSALPAENDELLAGMKRWGYVRDMGDKAKP